MSDLTNLADKAMRLVTAAGLIPKRSYMTRLEALRHPPSATFATVHPEPWGASVLIRTAHRGPINVDYFAASGVLAIRWFEEATNAA